MLMWSRPEIPAAFCNCNPHSRASQTKPRCCTQSNCWTRQFAAIPCPAPTPHAAPPPRPRPTLGRKVVKTKGDERRARLKAEGWEVFRGDTLRCFGKSAQPIDGKEDARDFHGETCKKSAQPIENNERQRGR